MTSMASRKRTAFDLSHDLLTHPLLRTAGADCVKALLAQGVTRSFSAGDFILREGEEGKVFWLLCRGGVRVFYTSAEGLEVTVKLFAAPGAFGELELLHQTPHMESCTAIDDVLCLAIPRPIFLDLLDRFPLFAKALLFDISARFLITAQHERALAFLTVPERLARLLLSYAKLYGQAIEGGVLLRTPLSQSELANGLGVARKSVVRAFKEWTDAGILARRGPYFMVTDMAALTEKAPPDILGIDWIAGHHVRKGS